MSEKPESDEFEDEEADEPVTEDGDVDLDQVIKDLDLAKRRGQKAGDPAWRRLERLRAAALVPAAELSAAGNGARVRTAGIVLMRQRPATASGVTFLTLEDESGQVNVIVWERVGREQRRALIESRLLEVHGELQHQEGVTHLIAHRLIDRSRLLGELTTRSRDFH